MVVITLFPGGNLQMVAALHNGYWPARSQEFLSGPVIKALPVPAAWSQNRVRGRGALKYYWMACHWLNGVGCICFARP